MTGKIDTVMIFSKSDRSGSTQNIYKKKFCNQISGISAKNAIFYGTEYEVLADFGSVGKIEINLFIFKHIMLCYKQEGHDVPDIAHLYQLTL